MNKIVFAELLSDAIYPGLIRFNRIETGNRERIERSGGLVSHNLTKTSQV